MVRYPDAVLSKKAKTVLRLSRKDRRLIQDMLDTMYAEGGVGLAAPQVGVSKRIIVISPRLKRGEEQILINPEILGASGGEEAVPEGCLSLPGLSCPVRRAKKVRVRAWDVNGNERIQEMERFSARVLQHEIDHLNGTLIVDRLDLDGRQAALSAYRTVSDR